MKMNIIIDKKKIQNGVYCDVCQHKQDDFN